MDMKQIDAALVGFDDESAALHAELEDVRVRLEDLAKRRNAVLGARMALLKMPGSGGVTVDVPAANIKGNTP